jgi:dTDP-4-dehydrorhamnose reductase
MMYISTDYVFGGDSERRTPYTESDATAPLNIYGRSKAEGEVAVVEHDGIVIRTSWLYAPWGKNFVLTMLRLGRERDEISVVNDQRGTPTSALGLARAIVLMVDTAAIESMRGIYHYTDGGECTWHDFACEIMLQAGLACRVEPCTTAERNMRAKRPAYSVLNTERIAAIEGITIAPWQERLKEVISLINK